MEHMSRLAPRTKYPEEAVTHALAIMAAHGGKIAPAARELGISPRTLFSWKHGDRRRAVGQTAITERTTQVQAERLMMASEWLDITKQALSRLREHLAAGTIRPHDLIVLAGVGQDKTLALTGGSRTSQDVNVTVTLADFYRRALPTKVIESSLASISSVK